MYPRPGLVELIQDEAPALFAFLLDAGFLGPERISDGIAYHRMGLHIEIGHSGGHEPEVGIVVIRGERRELLATCTSRPDTARHRTSRRTRTRSPSPGSGCASTPPRSSGCCRRCCRARLSVAAASVGRVTEDAVLAAISTSYDTVADTYVERFPATRLGPLGHAMLRAFAEIVLAESKGPVADLGCGPGALTAVLAGHGLEVSGIDLSPRMIELARAAHPGLEFCVGSITALGLPDGGLGGALAHFSTHHLPPEQLPTVFGEFHRVLAPGGHLLLGTHLGDDEHLRPTEAYGGHPVSYEWYLLPGDHIVGLLTAAGFDISARLDQPNPSAPGRSFAYFLGRRPS